jgi:hypothetical protein
MTSNLDVVKKYIDSGWANPPSSVIEANEKYLADDFKSFEKDGSVQANKEAYIGLSRLLLGSFTNFKWVLSGLRQMGDSVIMSGHFEGKHTKDLDLSAMGLGVIPPSGKMIVWPEASVEVIVQGDKIISQKAYAGASGIDAFLEPLGVKLPAA